MQIMATFNLQFGHANGVSTRLRLGMLRHVHISSMLIVILFETGGLLQYTPGQVSMLPLGGCLRVSALINF